jgi:hypothetical protein
LNHRTLVKIGSPRLTVDQSEATVTYPLSGFAHDELWFTLPSEFLHLVGDPTCDAAVVALLAPIMRTGSRCEIRGPISPRLAWNLEETVIPVTRRLLTDLMKPELVFEKFSAEDCVRGNAVLTGLSNGVDSLTVVAECMLSARVRPADRITHFLFNDVGSHGVGPDAPAVAAARWIGVEGTARELGVPIIRVRSNLDGFYDEFLNFQATTTLRNASVPLLLQHGSKRFLYASSFYWSQIAIKESDHMSRADPILLAALSTERVDMMAVGTEYNRIEKIQRIAHLDVAQRRLDVCVMSGTNCSRCWKCVRALFTLEMLGLLPQFSNRFDLDVYREERDRYIGKLWAEIEHPGLIDLRRFAKSKGVQPTLRWRATAFQQRCTRRLYRLIRKHLHARWRALPESTRQRFTPVARMLNTALNR